MGCKNFVIMEFEARLRWNVGGSAYKCGNWLPLTARSAGDHMSVPQFLLSRDQPACDGCQGEQPAADELPALRLVKVPDWPPFDGDPAAADSSAVAPWRPGAVSVAHAGGTAGAWAGSDAKPGGKPDSCRVSGTAAADRLEASSEWARRFARLLAEALAGARPVRQILPLTSQRARLHIGTLMPLFGGGQRPRVLRVIATRPALDVIEMTVIVAVGPRTRALAVRLEQAGPRHLAASPRCTPGWVCTDIEAA